MCGIDVLMVGLAGFEPTTSCPPDKRANQAALQPEWLLTLSALRQSHLNENLDYTPAQI